MEELNLGYIEKALAYSSIFGKDREIFCPAIIEFVSKKTILDENNYTALNIAKEFFLKHNQVPSPAEIKQYLKTEEQRDSFRVFLKGYKSFQKSKFDTKILLNSAEEFFRQRIIQSLIDDGFAKGMAGEPLDIGEVYQQMEKAMSIYMVDDLGLRLFEKTGSEDYIRELRDDANRISTGFAWLDQQIGGGLLTKGSAMYNFCAASNIGKSNFIKSLACNISKQGKNCLVVSLEMPRYIYADRFVAELADVAIYDLKNETEKIGQFLTSATDKGYGDILIKDFATGSLTPQGLSAFIKRAENHLNIKFDCVFVDYPELLKPSKNFTRHDLMVSSLYVETRALSFNHGIPFIVVSQLNRAGYDNEKPSMSNLGSSIGIATCSDFCGFLYATDDMKEINQFGFIVGKSRFGPVNKVHRFNTDPLTLKISESNLKEGQVMSIEPLEDETEEAGDFFDELMKD